MTLEDEFKYKTYKRLFKKLRKKAKILYYSKLLHECKTDSKPTWQVMKEITRKQKAISNLIPQEIKVYKTIIENPQDIAKEFNISNIIIDAYDNLKNNLFHVFKISIQQGIFPKNC